MMTYCRKCQWRKLCGSCGQDMDTPLGLLRNDRKILKGGLGTAVWQGSTGSLEFGHIGEHDVIIKQILSHLSITS